MTDADAGLANIALPGSKAGEPVCGLQHAAEGREGCWQKERSMRRSVLAASVAILLTALAVAPATAAPIHVLKPSLTTAVCLTGEQMRIRSDWSDQISDPAIGPTFTWTFKGPGLPASSITIPFIGPTLDPSFVQVDLTKFIGDVGLVDWNRWSSIATAATGSFTDKAHTIRQPNGGWSTCS